MCKDYKGDFLHMFPSFKSGKHTQFSSVSHIQAQQILAVVDAFFVHYIQCKPLLPAFFCEISELQITPVQFLMIPFNKLAWLGKTAHL